MTDLSISKAWDETKAVVARAGRLIANVALALVLLPETVAGVAVPPANLSGVQPPTWAPVVAIAVAIVRIIALIAIIRLVLTPATSVGEAIGHGVKRLLPGFAALLLIGIPLAIILALLLILFGGGDGLASLQSATPDPQVGKAILLFLVIAVLASVRFQMIMPVTTAEEAGPVAILRRSWELTAGHFWRLLAFFLLVLFAAGIVLLTAQFAGGIVARALFGDLKAFSLGALLVALVTGAVQAGFVAVTAIMLARIYVQLAGRGAASVPKSGT